MTENHGGQRVVVVALLVNLLIAACKFLAAFLSQSAAMFAEAVHSLTDTANQAFLLVGMRRSTRPPDHLHPFGYGTETYFWSFIVAGCIFLVGGAVSLWEGGEKLWQLSRGTYHPHGDVRWALGVLGVSIVLEMFSLRAAAKEFQEVRGNKTLRQALRDARDPTVITVLFEDAAAIAGLFIALAGVVATYLTGNPFWDAAASVLVGATLCGIAFFLGKDSMSLLLGEAVPEEEHQKILKIASDQPFVLEVVHARTLHIGPRDVLLAIKIRFMRHMRTDELEECINSLEAKLRSELPYLRRIYVEPGFREQNSSGRQPPPVSLS